VAYIWRAALHTFDPRPGDWGENDHVPNAWWLKMFRAFACEKGVFRLVPGQRDPCGQCREYLLTAPTEDALDLIEVTFQTIDRLLRHLPYDVRELYGLQDPDEAIKELNARFREHGIGYEFSNGQINRIDSKFIHAEAVKPALHLLHDAGEAFAGPLQEFLGAHERHRKGNQKDAITYALKSFESTMKAICSERRWTYDPNGDTAKQLIEIVFNNGLVPSYLQAHFTALRSVLVSGVPTVRNKTSGHGQGPVPTDVPAWLAAYVMHLTASNIVLLIEAHNALR
jgi:hypothetical protein